MVFSSKDRILIEQLHRNKGYDARKLVKEFPENGWKICSLGLYYDRTSMITQTIRRAYEQSC